jgi:hypothetical protein
MNGTFGSFLNTADGSLPFDLNEFYRESPPLVDHNQLSSIQVIQTQDQHQKPSAPLNDFYNSLLPPKVDSYNPAMMYGNDSYGRQSQQQQQQPPPLPNTAPPLGIANPYVPASINQSLSAIPLPRPQLTMQTSSSSLNASNDEYAGWNEWNDTPISPPSFERKGMDDNIVEYVDDDLRDIESSLNDIDHRQLFGAGMETKDVDHRNLISLTGSPGQIDVSFYLNLLK